MEEWVCSICLNNEKTSTVKLEPCNHEFHGNCIVTNLRINGPKCPNCRGLDERCKINFEYEEIFFIHIYTVFFFHFLYTKERQGFFYSDSLGFDSL